MDRSVLVHGLRQARNFDRLMEQKPNVQRVSLKRDECASHARLLLLNHHV